MQLWPFQRSDFPIYERWFADPEFNRQLGPMDQRWLDYVLTDTNGAQFSCICDDELVAVVGVRFPAEGHNYYVITDLAVRPDMRRSGIGRRVLALLLAHAELQQTPIWRACVMPNNKAGRAFLEHAGWQPVEQVLRKDDVIEFNLRNQLLIS